LTPGPSLLVIRAREGTAQTSRPLSCIDRLMADKKPPEDALSDLRRRVADARGDGASNDPPAQSAAGLALRFGGEFGAAIIVGALLGYGVDYFLHTQPWGLIIGFGLGFGAGVVNVVRTAQAYNKANPSDPNAPSIPDDDD
jgi:ATP synthase protein I